MSVAQYEANMSKVEEGDIQLDGVTVIRCETELRHLEASFGMQAYFSRIFFELVWGS